MISTIHNDLVLALTPVERYRSAGQFGSSNSLELWYLVVAVVAVVVLLIAFLLSRHHQSRLSEDNKRKREFFLFYARRSGFSDRQCEILYEMTKWPTVKNLEDIFIMPDAFENMAAYTWEQCLKKHGLDAAKSLQFEIQDIKVKLGFDTNANSQATRRGYIRVNLQKRAMISEFPFSYKSGRIQNTNITESEDAVPLLEDNEVVKFRPGVLTELAVTAVAMKVREPIGKGNRVLVMFELDKHDSEERASQELTGKAGKRIISHFGIIKRVDKCDGEFKLIVELINLTADQINKMIRLTSIAAKIGKQAVAANDSGDRSAELVGSGVSV